MRPANLFMAFLAFGTSVSAAAAPLTAIDRQEILDRHSAYVAGWLKNSPSEVMDSIVDDTVFIPHHGVMPKEGAAAISDFWFPGGKVVGHVVCFEAKATNLSGTTDHATMYGRTDLHYDLDGKRYNWIGNFLFNWKKVGGRWKISHMMASDRQPTIKEVPTAAGC